MAIDKNSKAYQNLLNSGYSDQQITDMYNKASSGQSRQEVVANTKPVTTTETPVNNQPAETPTPVKQETTVKQEETVGSTVPEIKQEGELKPLSQEYYNQTSDDAQSKIISNLNNYRQTNPEYFRDYESFKKNFSYDARNEEQKNTLDTWYGGYQKGMQLAGLPVQDLYTQYKDGQVSATELENLRVANPEKYAELQNQINKGNIVAAYDDDKGGTGTSIQDMAYEMAVQTFTKFMSGDSSSGASNIFRDYEDKMNDPEMLALSDQCTEVQEQMENIQSDLDSIKKQVEEEYAGTGATRSKINAIISDRSYELQLQLRTLNSEYNKYATQYNNRMQQYQNEFSMQLQEYQLNQQERNQQMQELGFAMDLMNFETNEQKAQREWDYWVKQQEYTNGNINSKDYDTRYKAALKSVQNLLAQYEGIPMQRSAEQMAQDILTAIDGGSDLGTELTKINKLIQEKPEYKKLYNQTFGTSQGFGNMVSIGGQDYVEYDGKLYTSEEFNKKYGNATNSANYNVVDESVFNTKGAKFVSDDKNTNGKYGGQCGRFANNYLESIGAGRIFGNEDITTREGWINSDAGKVGTIAVFDYGHKSSDGINHGHVGIVVRGPDANGNILVKDSNYGSDEIIQTREVNLKDASLKGFIDPSLDKNGMKLQSTGTTTTPSTTTTKTTSTSSNGTTTVTSTVSTESDGMVHLGSTKLTPSQFDDYVKKYIDGSISYSEVKSLGDDALNKVTERALQLGEEGYTPSTKITDPNKQASLESNLRKEYDKLTEDANATINWVQKMDDAYEKVDENLNAASQALVIAYNKILDESSVVREGEYARTAEGQSLLNQMGAKVKQLAKGGAGITKNELKSLVDMAHTFSENAEKYRDEMAQRAKISIDKYGLTPEAVLPSNVRNKIENKTVTWGTNIPTNGGTSGGTTSTNGGFNIPNSWDNFS